MNAGRVPRDEAQPTHILAGGVPDNAVLCLVLVADHLPGMLVGGVAVHGRDTRAILQTVAPRGDEDVDDVRILHQRELGLGEVLQMIEIGMDNPAVLDEVGPGTGRGKRAAESNLRQPPFGGGIGVFTLARIDLSETGDRVSVDPIDNGIERCPERQRG